MAYIYLTKEHPNNSKLEENDVGVILSRNDNTALVRYLREHAENETPISCIESFEVEETGDEYPHKICDRCFKHLGTERNFEKNRIKKGDKITKRPSCRDCRKIKNGISIRKSDREKWEKSKPANFSAFKCPICEKTTIAGISKVVLDHCHKTGAVRGWLCETCNTGIGRFDDNPDIVYKAIEWLMKEHKPTK